MYSHVVVATTKVRIFKQITTWMVFRVSIRVLLLLPQRYVFSSKSQHKVLKGIGFSVVVATTKVRIFKQITTGGTGVHYCRQLLLLPQRYVFSSKSQQAPRHGYVIGVVVATTKVRIFKQITTSIGSTFTSVGCCCYHKGTYFQANHNP